MNVHLKKGKLNNLGSVTPVDRLNGKNQTPSRLARSPPPRSRSSPPPAKRPRFEEHGAHSHTHTELQFALMLEHEGTAERSTSRKRSFDNMSNSQHTSNARGSQPAQPNVTEYRKSDDLLKPPPTSRKRVRPNVTGKKVVDGVELIQTDSESDTDGDVQVVRVPEVNVVPQRGGMLQFLDEVRKQFRGTALNRSAKVAKSTAAAHKVDKAIDKALNPKRNTIQEMDSSPDELAPEAHDMKKLPTKRPVASSPAFPPTSSRSLSRKGDIPQTKFAASSRSHDPRKKADDLVRAMEVIDSKICIARAVSGNYKYEGGKASGADECFLKLSDESHVLYPADSSDNIMEQYAYATVNLEKAKKISFSTDPTCRIISISRSTDYRISAGAKLLIEFQSYEDLEHFIGWVIMDRGDFHTPLEIIACEKDKLEKEFNKTMKEASRHTVIRDDPADDIELIQHNAAIRAGQAKPRHEPHNSTSQVKRKDAMRPPISTSLSHPEGTRRHNPPRHTQTTRHTYKLMSESPELPQSPSPPPEGWTVKNEGWERQWRNSLIFPPHGKGRATVDKEDIPRLDEGEFLNDNLIIFYLRYLQHTLEARRPDLAQRIYFQNTFFYEKLKSTKTSSGINYDSVKAWTSKVDLFTKDFIIVPINELSHWYVAIIYNAPKLLPSLNKTEASDIEPKDTITIEEDADDSGKVSCASPASGNQDQPTITESALSTEHDDVIKHLSRMSISSSDLPNGKTKKIIATDQVNPNAEVQAIRQEQDVQEVPDTSGFEPDVEQMPSSNSNLPRKKAAKRPSIGPRKYDPDQPRIITLDSLALSHSPACSCLRQYLVAELKDKKGIEIPPLKPLGMTVKEVPQQTNYCDCGLYLLGYIKEFLMDPDKFIRSILQRDNQISWNLNPSQLRNDIRDLIFVLQKEQQSREDAQKEEKRKAGSLKKRKRPEAEHQPAQRDVQPRMEQVIGLHQPRLQAEETVAKVDDSVVEPTMESPAPKASHQEPKAVSDSEEGRNIPGSFPESPTAIRVHSRSSSTVANVDTVRQNGSPKFLSPESPRGSSLTKPMVVEDSEASQKQTQDYVQGYGEPNRASPPVVVRESPQPRNNAHRPDVKLRDYKEAPTTSHYFAGRQDGDRMAMAKLRDEPAHSDVIDISD